VLNLASSASIGADIVPCSRLIGAVVWRREITPDKIVMYCCRCKVDRPVSEFWVDRKQNGRILAQSQCKACRAAHHKEWWSKLSKERKDSYKKLENKELHRQNRKKAEWELRLEMIAAYGGRCVCCGEREPLFLTLEHLKGGGRAHRRRLHRASSIYKELRSQGWPMDYTVLCFNCNSVRGQTGRCPHESIRENTFS
jgi:hypothetical protein